jgi:uncharacterized protein (TIGR00297 family)
LSGLALGAWSLPDLRSIEAAPLVSANRVLIGAGVNVALAAVAYALRGVGLSGAVGGAVLGTALFAGGGWRAFALLGLFFVLGTAATRVAPQRKRAMGVSEGDGGRRGAAHAFANGTVGLICAIVAGSAAGAPAWTAALVAAFATAAGDTVSSEIGQIWGGTPRLITNLRRVPPGTDGAISWVGTLAGLTAASLLTLASVGIELLPWGAAPAVIVASQVGGAVDSLLGATAERAGWLGNHGVNFANTAAGAACAWAIVAWTS